MNHIEKLLKKTGLLIDKKSKIPSKKKKEAKK